MQHEFKGMLDYPKFVDWIKLRYPNFNELIKRLYLCNINSKKGQVWINELKQFEGSMNVDIPEAYYAKYLKEAFRVVLKNVAMPFFKSYDDEWQCRSDKQLFILEMVGFWDLDLEMNIDLVLEFVNTDHRYKIYSA